MEIESDVQRKVKEMKKIIIKEALINFKKKKENACYHESFQVRRCSNKWAPNATMERQRQ